MQLLACLGSKTVFVRVWLLVFTLPQLATQHLVVFLLDLLVFCLQLLWLLGFVDSPEQHALQRPPIAFLFDFEEVVSLNEEVHLDLRLLPQRVYVLGLEDGLEELVGALADQLVLVMQGEHLFDEPVLQKVVDID